MNLHSLPRIISKRKKRLGRGLGSGKGGHTVGRGQKGQKSRGKVGIAFFGTKMKKSLLKRLPMQRGKGKLKPKAKPTVIALKRLEVFAKGATVDVDTLIKAGIVKEEDVRRGLKIVSGGKIGKGLNVKVATSKSARGQIEKAGGKVEF